jgi:hypothetical protein
VTRGQADFFKIGFKLIYEHSSIITPLEDDKHKSIAVVL